MSNFFRFLFRSRARTLVLLLRHHHSWKDAITTALSRFLLSDIIRVYTEVFIALCQSILDSPNGKIRDEEKRRSRATVKRVKRSLAISLSTTIIFCDRDIARIYGALNRESPENVYANCRSQTHKITWHIRAPPQTLRSSGGGGSGGAILAAVLFISFCLPYYTVAPSFQTRYHR